MIGVVWHMNTAFPKLWPRQNGIYKITNRITGRFYIGKAEDKRGFYRRWGTHRRELRKNIHSCHYLQNSYNKHGESCFTFEILEIRDYKEDLRCLESEYITNLKAMYFEKGYNIKNENSATQIPRIFRENNSNAIEFEILDPNGNLIKGRNLTQFSEEMGVSPGSMSRVVNGKLKSYKGFRSPKPEFYAPPNEYRILSPEKELIVFNNLRQFEIEIGAHSNAIFEVLSGKNSHFKGYHLENPSPQHQKRIDRFFNKKFLINKDLGLIVRFVAIKTFARKYKVSKDALFDFFAGRDGNLTKSYNWTTPTEEEMKSYPIIEEDF